MVNKIKARCMKVLPLVYDDSLSYYETICKLVGKINELVDYIDGKYSEKLEENINDIIKRIFGDILYKEEFERLSFSASIYTIKDGVHTYEPNSGTMEIKPVLEEE